jgi:hypothetical protein
MDDHDLAPKATKHDFGTCGGSFRLSHDPALPFSAWNPKSGIERNACEALRNPECDGRLLPAAPDARPCGGGTISEDRESGVGVGAGPPACRPVASIESMRAIRAHVGSGKKYKRCCGGAAAGLSPQRPANECHEREERFALKRLYKRLYKMSTTTPQNASSHTSTIQNNQLTHGWTN